MPVELLGHAHVTTIRFERTALDAKGHLKSTGDQFELTADTVFKAIGQALDAAMLGDDAADLVIENGRIAVDASGRTSLPDVWAGGDCISPGDDLTVTAVQQGKVAALDIDRRLRGD